MKIRTDFVTNSSSSSFIVAYKEKPLIDKETIEKYPWLEYISDFIFEKIKEDGNAYQTEAAELFETKEELEQWIIREYGYYSENKVLEEIFEDNEYLKNIYDKAVECFNNGYYVLQKRISYSDELLSKIIKAICKNNDEFILLSDMEY